MAKGKYVPDIKDIKPGDTLYNATSLHRRGMQKLPPDTLLTVTDIDSLLIWCKDPTGRTWRLHIDLQSYYRYEEDEKVRKKYTPNLADIKPGILLYNKMTVKQNNKTLEPNSPLLVAHVHPTSLECESMDGREWNLSTSLQNYYAFYEETRPEFPKAGEYIKTLAGFSYNIGSDNSGYVYQGEIIQVSKILSEPVLSDTLSTGEEIWKTHAEYKHRGKTFSASLTNRMYSRLPNPSISKAHSRGDVVRFNDDYLLREVNGGNTRVVKKGSEHRVWLFMGYDKITIKIDGNQQYVLVEGMYDCVSHLASAKIPEDFIVGQSVVFRRLENMSHTPFDSALEQYQSLTVTKLEKIMVHVTDGTLGYVMHPEYLGIDKKVHVYSPPIDADAAYQQYVNGVTQAISIEANKIVLTSPIDAPYVERKDWDKARKRALHKEINAVLDANDHVRPELLKEYFELVDKYEEEN